MLEEENIIVATTEKLPENIDIVTVEMDIGIAPGEEVDQITDIVVEVKVKVGAEEVVGMVVTEVLVEEVDMITNIIVTKVTADIMTTEEVGVAVAQMTDMKAT